MHLQLPKNWTVTITTVGQLLHSLPSWLPPAMLEIRILALYLGDQELCSKYFCEFYSMNYLEDYTLDESLEEGLDLFKHFC